MGRLFNFSSSRQLWKKGDNCWLQDQNVCGNNIQSLMDLGFDFSGLLTGFHGPELYYVLGKIMRLKMRLGNDQ